MSGNQAIAQPTTMLESIIESLADAARHQPGVDEKPAAVLWTDSKGEWRPLIPLLRERLPQLLVFGKYNLEKRIGPAIWLKCAIARQLDDVAIPADAVPIVYLPEISRQQLRAGDECPRELRPLVELQYRGCLWTQQNGRDWTIEAFLVSENALGLDVARDAGTRRSIEASLTTLAETPVSQLTGKRLASEDFDRLMIGDQPRDLLTWMNAPEDVCKRFNETGKWHAFRNRCRDEYAFDPDKDGETVAGERFGLRDTDGWLALWDRFCESPGLYPRIPDLLIRSKPSGGKLIFDRETWPDENDAAEDKLRQALQALENKSAADARAVINQLESEHGSRRKWVWARLGRSPLVEALEHLAALAQHTESQIGGDSPAEMAELYAGGAWLADDAALRALATHKAMTDGPAIHAAVRSLYLPWLEGAAKRLQDQLKDTSLPNLDGQPRIAVDRGHCILFADGLRFDLSQRVVSALEERGLKAKCRNRWSALPCVTATAKPAVSPVAEQLVGEDIPSDYAPTIQETGDKLTHPRFQKLLEQAGYTVISKDATPRPSGKDARGWTEFGNIDKRGHDLQIELAPQIEDEVKRLAERIVALLDAGWKSIRLVTDHGWLLIPDNLPKHDLPPYLTESKWSRCARIKGDSQVTVPKNGWSWNQKYEYASGPGISCFRLGTAYSHGGISLQECLIPDIVIEPSEDAGVVKATVSDLAWRGQRCRVQIDPADSSLRIDIRTSPNSAATSIINSPRNIEDNGKVSVLVENEDRQGSAAVVVVLNSCGRIVGKESTIVGGEE